MVDDAWYEYVAVWETCGLLDVLLGDLLDVLLGDLCMCCWGKVDGQETHSTPEEAT